MSRFPLSIAAAGVSALLMIVGGFAPWAKASVLLGSTTFFSTTINGTEGGRDGWIVVAAAGVAIALLVVMAFTWRRWLALIPLLAGIVGAATAGYDISDINSVSTSTEHATADASAQCGIYLSLIASVGLVLASLGAIYELKMPRTASDALAVHAPAAKVENRPHEEPEAAADSRDAHDREQPASRSEA